MKLHVAGRGLPDYSDEDDDFSSGNDEGEGEGSDSEPVIDERRRGRKNKISGNVRVCFCARYYEYIQNNSIAKEKECFCCNYILYEPNQIEITYSYVIGYV